MRKLLLAATAVVGAMGLAAAAHAQAPASGYIMGPDPNLYGMGSSTPGASALPGSIQAYFRGRLVSEMAVSGDSARTVGGNKQGALAFGGYARMFAGMEGTAANGLQYGAYFEIRQNYYSGLGPTAGGGQVVYNLLHFRHETVYVKGDWGAIHAGMTDAAISLFLTGTWEGITPAGDGTWNSDASSMFDGATQISWPFPEDSGLYGTTKVLYLSPNFAGFDFGVGFEPNDSNWATSLAQIPAIMPGCGTAGSGPAGCGNLSSSATPIAIRRNMVDAVGRYQGKLGPVAVTGTLGIMTSGHVNSPMPVSNPTIVDTGWTFAMGGLAFGGNYVMGNSKASASGLFPLLKGSPHESAYIIGASYAYGPFIAGASFMAEDSAGFYDGVGVTHPLQERGVTLSGAYAWAPGSQLYVAYLYGTRHQSGHDFLTGAPGVGSNNTHASGLIIGNQFDW